MGPGGLPPEFERERECVNEEKEEDERTGMGTGRGFEYLRRTLRLELREGLGGRGGSAPSIGNRCCEDGETVVV